MTRRGTREGAGRGCVAGNAVDRKARASGEATPPTADTTAIVLVEKVPNAGELCIHFVHRLRLQTKDGANKYKRPFARPRSHVLLTYMFKIRHNMFEEQNSSGNVRASAGRPADFVVPADAVAPETEGVRGARTAEAVAALVNSQAATEIGEDSRAPPAVQRGAASGTQRSVLFTLEI